MFKISCNAAALNVGCQQSWVRNLAVTGRHSKNIAAKKNKADAMKTKIYTRLGVKILMVGISN